MKKGFAANRWTRRFATALVALLLLPVVTKVSAKDEIEPFALPELTQTSEDAWLNSPPLTIDDLKGQVVLLDFWTFDCWNCYRSFPWLKRLEKRLAGRTGHPQSRIRP